MIAQGHLYRFRLNRSEEVDTKVDDVSAIELERWVMGSAERGHFHRQYRRLWLVEHCPARSTHRTITGDPRLLVKRLLRRIFWLMIHRWWTTFDVCREIVEGERRRKRVQEEAVL